MIFKRYLIASSDLHLLNLTRLFSTGNYVKHRQRTRSWSQSALKAKKSATNYLGKSNCFLQSLKSIFFDFLNGADGGLNKKFQKNIHFI